MESATESELGGLFENFQKATSMRTDLAEMGHLQPPTLEVMYNTVENIIVNGTAKKIFRAIGMRFYYVQDRIRKIFSTYSGKRERKTCRIMSQNTTQYSTTELRDQDIKNQQKKT